MATEAFALAGNAAAQGGQGGYQSIIMLVAMFAIFYFFTTQMNLDIFPTYCHT